MRNEGTERGSSSPKGTETGSGFPGVPAQEGDSIHHYHMPTDGLQFPCKQGLLHLILPGLTAAVACQLTVGVTGNVPTQLCAPYSRDHTCVLPAVP